MEQPTLSAYRIPAIFDSKTEPSMTLDEIFAAYTPGTREFHQAIRKHCDFDINDRELQRIANDVVTAEQFLIELEEETWWMDEYYYDRGDDW